MRILALITSLIFLSNLEVKSQDYVPFPTDSATYTQYNYYFGFFEAWLPSPILLGGDTVINELSYSKIFLNSFDLPNGPFSANYIGALREDDNKRVFFKPDSLIIEPLVNDPFTLFSFNSENEVLLYDFNVSIGDTLIYEGSPHEELYGYNYVVIDTTQFEIGGELRYGFIMSVPYESNAPFFVNEVYLIEGIGSSLGLLNPYSNMTPNAFFSAFQYSLITCYETPELFWENTLHDDDLSDVEISDCTLPVYSVSEISLNRITLYPNPTFDNLFIESSGSPIQSIQIYSQSGKLVYSDMKSRSKILELDLSKLDSGVYFVQIIDASGAFTEKLVKR